MIRCRKNLTEINFYNIINKKIIVGKKMNEVIASILDAEKKAEEIVKNSTEKSKKIRQTADEDGEKIKNGAVAVFKLHRTSALKDAEKKAAAEYDKITESGKAEADKIVGLAADKIDSLAEQVVKGITG